MLITLMLRELERRATAWRETCDVKLYKGIWYDDVRWLQVDGTPAYGRNHRDDESDIEDADEKRRGI